jgi:diaminopimelate decarboxylase
MPKKLLPFTKNQIEKIIKKYPTPFHLYDEESHSGKRTCFQKRLCLERRV